MTRSVLLYRLFRRADGVASVRSVVLAMIAVAVTLTGVGVVRVSRQHEVLRLGYQLAKRTDEVRSLKEAHRRLELERATLTAPDRIRRLATELGMTPVAPDRIRVITEDERGPIRASADLEVVPLPLRVASRP